MKNHSFILYIFFISINIVNANCQEKDSSLNKARYYMENNEYGMAISILNSYSIQFPEEYIPYELSGDCLTDSGSYDEAIKYYLKVMDIKPDLTRIFFKLGNTYEMKEKSDSSIYFFMKFLKFYPHSVEGHLRLAILYMNRTADKRDSSLFYASQANKIEPGNSRALNILAMSYFSIDQYDQASRIAVEGLKRDSINIHLLQTAAISSFFLRDFKTSCIYFKKAIDIDPKNTLIRDYHAQSLLMRNTEPGKIFFRSDGSVGFHNFNSENISEIEKNSNNQNGSYHYSNLIKIFHDNPAELGLDQYFMLYYGFTNQPDYTPYKEIDKELKEYAGNDLSEASTIAEDLVLKYPVYFPIYYTLAKIHYQLGNYNKYSEYILLYYGFLESVKATGEGINPSTAIIVIETDHEYEVALNRGYSVYSRKLISDGGHKFDILSVNDIHGNNFNIYFNIEKPYHKLMIILPERNKKKLKKGI
jgi:tetratricopeptide (TPR) repeat protein